MDESEEFEFRRRFEAEKAAREAQQSSHAGTFLNLPPRRESTVGGFFTGLKDSFANAGIGLTQRAMELTGNPRAKFIEQQVANRRADSDLGNLVRGRPSISEATGGFVGDVVPVTAIGAALGPSLPAAAAAGGLAGLARPTASGAELASNVAGDALFGLGGALAVRAFMPRAKVEPEHVRSILAGRREGIPFTGGQIADNPIVQRAEAHAMWNPATKWHAIPLARKQDDAFVRGLLKQTGLPETAIPKNPSLSPEMLGAANDAISRRYASIFPETGTFDVSPSKSPDLWKQLRGLRPENINLTEDDRRIVADAARQVRLILQSNNNRVPAPLYQDTIELVDEARKRLTNEGAKKAGDKLSALYDELVGALPDRQAYQAVQADYARLMTIEDLLTRSKGMGQGVPDRAKLGQAVQRSLPGGVTRDRSTMADLARGGERSIGVGALPDRATGLPIPSDFPNALTYWRWNNPAAQWGLLNPAQRDAIEMGLRFQPGTVIRQEQERIQSE